MTRFVPCFLGVINSSFVVSQQSWFGLFCFINSHLPHPHLSSFGVGCSCLLLLVFRFCFFGVSEYSVRTFTPIFFIEISLVLLPLSPAYNQRIDSTEELGLVVRAIATPVRLVSTASNLAASHANHGYTGGGGATLFPLNHLPFVLIVCWGGTQKAVCT